MHYTRKTENEITKLIKGVYKDNWFNRRLQRVGMPYGSDVDSELKKYRTTTTADLYRVNGEWTESREKLHKQIINNFFQGKESGQKNPTATILAGGAGSGKTYVYQKFYGKIDKNSVYINSDDIKQQLPEYDKYIKKDYISAAHKVHEESSYISKLLINEAIENKYHVTIDTTLSNMTKAKKLIADLKKQGYDIKLVFVDVPPNKAAYSAQKRGADTKRWVPRKVVYQSNINSRKVVKHLIENKLISKYAWFDNSGLNKKQPPKRVKL